jgi:pimeloyl-ACP methyl ester carboxylesterase
MTRAQCNDLELEYGTVGYPFDPALVLVAGARTQMTYWDPDFCGLLADEGFRVVRFDNRDIGLSTYLDELAVPDLAALVGGDAAQAPYGLADMADDAVGLLDALGIDRAHAVGASMGGIIVQRFAPTRSCERKPPRAMTARSTRRAPPGKLRPSSPHPTGPKDCAASTCRPSSSMVMPTG